MRGGWIDIASAWPEHEVCNVTPAQVLFRATTAGVIFTLTPSNRLRLGGDREAINLWLGTIGEFEAELIAELAVQAESGPMDGDHLPAATDISPDAGQRTLEPGIGLTTKGIEQ